MEEKKSLEDRVHEIERNVSKMCSTIDSLEEELKKLRQDVLYEVEQLREKIENLCDEIRNLE